MPPKPFATSTRSGRTSSVTRTTKGSEAVKNMKVIERYHDADSKENLEPEDKIAVSDERAEVLVAAGVAEIVGDKATKPPETKPATGATETK